MIITIFTAQQYDYEWIVDNSTDQLQVRKSGGAWGSVCDDGFDDNTAHAVCNWISKMEGTQLLNGYSWTTADTVLK